jgi:tRNA (mo5U34)-methyltransferase
MAAATYVAQEHPMLTAATSTSTPGLPGWRRVCRVLADEGAAGVTRRARTLLQMRRSGAAATPAGAYQQRVEQFRVASRRLARGDLSNFYWYHTIDLGQGVVTPGDYDYRDLLHVYQFPEDMRGMRVLDVGSATGFFAFEFERRGGQVVSVDLPSIAECDMPAGEDKELTLRDLMAAHGVSSVEELTRVHLHGPFELCRAVLGSRVERHLSRVYDLTPDTFGGRRFDLVFAGDILLHTFSPLMALAALAPLCAGRLIVAQHLSDVTPEKPVMVFTGTARDRRTWWHPNRLCLEQMLRRVGFTDVRFVGEHTVSGRGGEWVTPNQAIVHASR